MKNQVENIFNKSDSSSVENIPVEKYLTFFIEKQLLAIPSSHVVEIMRMQPITYMPKLPPFVKGIINLRGKIVPLIDLRLKFGSPAREYDDRTSIIVVETSDYNVGLIVDSVNDVTDIYTNQITDSPTRMKGRASGAVIGIATLEDGAAMLLDIMKVLSNTIDDGLTPDKVLQNAVNE